MKKILAILAVLLLGFFGGRLSHHQPASAEGAGVGAVVPVLPPCKDVNGDGGVDLSDPVYLLQWLYLGGPEPECPPSNGQSVGLPDTGQAKCYDDSGNEIPCDSASCPGQDGLYATGCPSEGRFVDNGDGTVTDTCMGLMWQKDTADVNDDRRIDINDRLPWCDALAYCDDLSLAGHDDWRLPNVRELQSIVDYGRGNPAIDPVFGAVSWYWSSTSLVDEPGFAWFVAIAYGYVSDGYKGNPGRVRAVRSAEKR